MAKPQSPCIGVCKFRRPGPAGMHCIGCSMTEAQKKLAKKARRPKEAEGFAALVMAQQAALGGYGHWRAALLKRGMRKGRAIPDVVRRAS